MKNPVDPYSRLFAQFIKLEKKAKGIPMGVLASEADLSKSFIYMVMENISQPSISSATRILKALGRTWADFHEFAKEVA
jgi:transcriptional regulator with XRE-family HTH domain